MSKTETETETGEERERERERQSKRPDTTEPDTIFSLQLTQFSLRKVGESLRQSQGRTHGLRDAIGWSAGRIRVGARPIEANSTARHLRSCSFHLHHVTLLAGPMHGRAAK